MFNYLKSEGRRNLSYRGNWIFFFVCLLIILTVCISFWRQHLNYGDELHTMSNRLYDAEIKLLTVGLPIFAAVFVGNSYKNVGLQRQILSAGTRRSSLYFGDYIIFFGLGIVFAALLILISMGLAFLMSGNWGLVIHRYHKVNLKKLLGFLFFCLQLLLPLYAMAHSLSYLIKNQAAFVASFIALSLVLPLVIYPFANEQHPMLLIISRLSPYRYLMHTAMDITTFDPLWLNLCIYGDTVAFLGLGWMACLKREY